MSELFIAGLVCIPEIISSTNTRLEIYQTRSKRYISALFIHRGFRLVIFMAKFITKHKCFSELSDLISFHIYVKSRGGLSDIN